MAIEFLDNIPAVKRSLVEYAMARAADLPELTRAQLATALAQPSDVVAIVDAGEALYAVAGKLDNEGRAVAAQALGFATTQGWSELAVDGRGARMVSGLRRRNREAPPESVGEWPTIEEDPAPAARMLPQPERDPPPPPPEV